jgi:hypothetical protein
VTGVVGAGSGCATGGASRVFRSKTRFSSVCAVSGSAGRKDARSLPISPAAVTARICGAAHDDTGFAVEAAALDAKTSESRQTELTRRRVTASSHRPASLPALVSFLVELEITPEPSAEERAAIAAALEEAEETPLPWREEDEEP